MGYGGTMWKRGEVGNSFFLLYVSYDDRCHGSIPGCPSIHSEE